MLSLHWEATPVHYEGAKVCVRSYEIIPFQGEQDNLSDYTAIRQLNLELRFVK